MAQEQVVWGFHIQNVSGDWPVVNEVVAIGWHELGDVSKIPASRKAFKERYAAAIPAAKPGAIPVSAGQIFRFVHEAQIGDMVIYPSRHDRMINVGRITGPYQYVVDGDAEYPHR